MAEEATNPEADIVITDAADLQGVDNDHQPDDDAIDEGDEGTDGDVDTPEGEPEVEDDDEIEFEGVKAKVPKALAAAIAQGALRHKDYTQKTQALAEDRRALESREAEITQRQDVYKANIAKVAQLHSVDTDLKALNDLTQDQWDQIKAKDIDEYRNLKDLHRDLKEQRATLQTELDTAEAEAKRQAEETSTKEFADARQAMGRALFGLDKPANGPDLSIPGLTPQNANEVLGRISAFASTALGIPPSELAQVTDPRVIKGLHLAMTVVQAASKQTAVEQVEKAQKTKPAKSVSGSAPNARRTTDSSGDGLSDEEWIRRENERLAGRRRR